jgi:hypothetical protein
LCNRISGQLLDRSGIATGTCGKTPTAVDQGAHTNANFLGFLEPIFAKPIHMAYRLRQPGIGVLCSSPHGRIDGVLGKCFTIHERIRRA